MSGFTNIQMSLGSLPASGIIVAFTATGLTMWEVPPGVTEIDILCVAGGGPGNGASGSPAIGSGGGSGGGVVEALAVSVTPGDILGIFVGSGAPEGGAASGSDVEAPGPVILCAAPPGAEANVTAGAADGNGGGGACSFGAAFASGGAGIPNGFDGGDGIADDITFTFFINGGGGGAGERGHDGVGPSAGGAGGNGRDMSAGWGTTYGEGGVFGGGGGGNGYVDPGLIPPGAEGLGHGANSGGGGSSTIPSGPLNAGDDGIVLIRY